MRDTVASLTFVISSRSAWQNLREIFIIRDTSQQMCWPSERWQVPTFNGLIDDARLPIPCISRSSSSRFWIEFTRTESNFANFYHFFRGTEYIYVCNIPKFPHPINAQNVEYSTIMLSNWLKKSLKGRKGSKKRLPLAAAPLSTQFQPKSPRSSLSPPNFPSSYIYLWG